MKTLILAATAAIALAAGPALAQAEPTPAPAAAAPAAAAAAPAGAAAVGTANIVATTKADGEFSTLAKAIDAAGLTQELSAAGPYTFFAPTDAAFAKLPPEQLASLMQPANKEQLRTLLQNHVVEGQAKAEYFAGKAGEMTALGGGKLALDGASGVKVNGATIVKADIAASNGVIHAIDSVILPAPAATAAAAPAAEAEEGSTDEK